MADSAMCVRHTRDPPGRHSRGNSVRSYRRGADRGWTAVRRYRPAGPPSEHSGLVSLARMRSLRRCLRSPRRRPDTFCQREGFVFQRHSQYAVGDGGGLLGRADVRWSRASRPPCCQSRETPSLSLTIAWDSVGRLTRMFWTAATMSSTEWDPPPPPGISPQLLEGPAAPGLAAEIGVPGIGAVHRDAEVQRDVAPAGRGVVRDQMAAGRVGNERANLPQQFWPCEQLGT